MENQAQPGILTTEDKRRFLYKVVMGEVTEEKQAKDETGTYVTKSFIPTIADRLRALEIDNRLCAPATDTPAEPIDGYIITIGGEAFE